MDYFQTRLRKLREKKNISKTALAKMLGYDKSLISKWEKGRKIPSLKSLEKVANFFGVSTDYLLGLSESPFHRAPDEISLRELQGHKAELDRISSEMVLIANRISAAPDEPTKEAARRELEKKHVEMDRVAQEIARIANRLSVSKKGEKI